MALRRHRGSLGETSKYKGRMAMETYSVLFCDDFATQFEDFKILVQERLESEEGIRLEPLHYAPCYERMPGLERVYGAGVKSVKELVGEEGNRYDIVVCDLNFQEAGFGGPRDGFKILRYIKERSPDTEVMLFTAYGRMVFGSEAAEFARDVDLKKGAWVEFDIKAPDRGWGPVRTTLKGMLNLVDQRREMQRLMRDEDLLPALYHVVLRYRGDEDIDPQTQFVEGPLQVEVTPRFPPLPSQKGTFPPSAPSQGEAFPPSPPLQGGEGGGPSIAFELTKNQSRLFQFLARERNLRRVHSAQLLLRRLNEANAQVVYKPFPESAKRALVEMLGVGCIAAGIAPQECDFAGRGLALPGRMGYDCARRLGVCVREAFERKITRPDPQAELSPASFTGCVREIREHIRRLNRHYENLLVNRRGYGYGLAATVEWRRIT
ncbi:MAG: hypothetical protein NZT92_06675 [Abditibacteriales bacterium]|nr:hypothetical protein [Abditibacteriales bacterium]MDW8365630.1 hypothetical protein [Abditibacteriales bacterium]